MTTTSRLAIAAGIALLGVSMGCIHIDVHTDSEGGDNTTSMRSGGTTPIMTYSNGANTATETVKKTAELSGVKTVQVRGTFGGISVEKSPDDKLHLTVVKTLSSDKFTRVALTPYLEKVTVTLETTGDSVKIGEQIAHDMPKNVSAGVEYRVSVPASLHLDVKTENGAVSLTDVGDGVTAVSTFGEVKVVGSRGTLDARSNNGEVTVDRIASCPSLTVRSDFGAVQVEHAAARRLSARSGNGEVTVSNCPDVQDGTYRSDFGAVTLTHVGGTVDAHSGNGAVELDASQVAGVTLGSDFGSVTAKDITASGRALSVTLKSGNGSVDFDGEASSLTLASDFGSVTGHLTSRLAFSGGTVHSGNGSVDLSLPQGIATRLDVRAKNGVLSVTGLPGVSVNGDEDSKSALATLNRGMGLLQVSSDFGSVSVHGD